MASSNHLFTLTATRLNPRTKQLLKATHTTTDSVRAGVEYVAWVRQGYQVQVSIQKVQETLT